ncbi:MAG TPA: hypothetical protein VGR03_11015 [Candidatus Acidoferrum sp.]|nr:hypothetical protein [Candidatus Acidoferrum sp.]
MRTHPAGAVIASEAKQSSLLPPLVDCFVASLLAMTPLAMSRRPRDLVLRVDTKAPRNSAANTIVCSARRLHATSPGGLPEEAAARMDARDEAWRKARAGEPARPE